MEIVNKIQIRLDAIRTSASTISIPFGLDFFPIDNTELQETEFVEKEKEKAVNPIFDQEKYPFYPTYRSINSPLILNDAYRVNYLIDKSLSFLELTEEDITYFRNPFIRTYLRLNFYDSRDTKVQKLVARETIHLRTDPNWFNNEILKDQTTIPLKFESNFQNLIYNSSLGEGFNFYWFKNDLPITLYIRPSLMNAKTGKVINLYSTTNLLNPLLSDSVNITSNGYNYIECKFFYDKTKRQQYYYILNEDGNSDVTNTGDPLSPVESINNTITINLKTY